MKTKHKRSLKSKSTSRIKNSSKHSRNFRKLLARRNVRIGFILLFAIVGAAVAYFALAATQVSSTAYCINGTMANGERTHDGAAAKNGVPFGTKYRLLSGTLAGKEVTIKDRSAPGATGLDIWMGSCGAARNYGRQSISIEQISGSTPAPVGGGEAPCSHPTIRRENTGGRDCVIHLQQHLNHFGYNLKFDGIWGPLTDNAVRDFQRRQGFGGFGIVGPSTWERLHGGGAPPAAPPTSAPPKNQPNQPPQNQNSGNSSGDRLGTGQTLYSGQYLRSQNGQYLLRMQDDGNLVVYAPGNRPIWNSRTGGGGARLVMQGDGNLVIYRGSTPLWASGTHGRGASFAIMQNDGNFVIYTNTGTPTWASK